MWSSSARQETSTAVPEKMSRSNNAVKLVEENLVSNGTVWYNTT